MRWINLIAATLSLSFSMMGCNNPSQGETIKNELISPNKNAEAVTNKNFTTISPQEAKKVLDTKKDALLLDVRTLEEYSEKHIPGSVLIPVETISQEAESKLKDKSATILVYCRSGRRSVTASEALVKLGYTHIYNFGGINDWPFETESGSTNLKNNNIGE